MGDDHTIEKDKTHLSEDTLSAQTNLIRFVRYQ